MFQLFAKGISELFTLFMDCFITESDATLRRNFFNISEAESKTKIKPDAMRNNFGGKTMTMIQDWRRRLVIMLLEPSNDKTRLLT